jgi:CO dehydrogenase nickel-insertion accessory protein CooC1
VANKIASPADEKYVRDALAGQEIAAVIPWSEEIRAAEREGRPVLKGASKELLKSLETLLQQLPPTGGKERSK